VCDVDSVKFLPTFSVPWGIEIVCLPDGGQEFSFTGPRCLLRYNLSTVNGQCRNNNVTEQNPNSPTINHPTINPTINHPTITHTLHIKPLLKFLISQEKEKRFTHNVKFNMKHDGYVSILLAITLHYGVQGFVPLIPNRVPHCLIEAPSSFTTGSSTRIAAGRGRGRGGGRGGGGGGRTRRSGGRGGRGRGDGRGGRGRGGRGRGGRGRQADDTFDSDPFGDQNSYGDDGDSSPRYEPQPEYQDRSTSFDDDDGNDFFGDFEEDFEYDDDDNEEEEEESMENSVSQPRPPPSQFFSKKPISDPSVSTSVDDDKAKANNANYVMVLE
jgi:hypothetical protein